MLSNFMIKNIIRNRLILSNCRLGSRLSTKILVQIRNGHIVPRKQNTQLSNTDYNRIMALESEKSSVIKIKKDPREKIIILLGGENSHFVGMCESSLDDPEVYDKFKRAEQVFGWNLMDMCINGPIEELSKTKHLLPCVFMANLAALNKAEKRIPNLRNQLVAMTSSGIGELNALVYEDAIKFDDALHYLKIRTDAMALLAENSNTRSLFIWETAATNPNFMCRAAKEWCIRQGISERDAFCEITHWLHPETKIIGGHEEAINFILKNTDHFALKRASILKYDLAYYSSYLRPVGEILKAVVNKFTLKEPDIRIHSTNGEVYVRKNFLKTLAEQVFMPCRIETNLSRIYNRTGKVPFPLTFECSAKRGISINLRQANFQAYKRCKTILSD